MVFAAAAVGAGLVRTVATTYLPVLLSAVKDAPGLIGAAMVVNALAGFAVPLVVGLWSDRSHTARHGRRPFLLGGAVLTVCGLGAIALGYQNSFLMLTLAGLITYVGVNIVTTAHRTLVHDCFEDGGHARGNGAQEVAALAGALVGLVCGGMLSEVADWAPFALAAVLMPLLVWPTFRRIPVAAHLGDAPVAEHHHRPLHYYLRTVVRPGVRAMIAAEVLWVLGYAALPVFFVLYAETVLGLGTGLASLWLATFALAAGLAMLVGGRIRTRRYKPVLVLGVALMGCGFLAIASSTNLVVGLARRPAGGDRLRSRSRRSAMPCSRRSSPWARPAATPRSISRSGPPRRPWRCRSPARSSRPPRATGRCSCSAASRHSRPSCRSSSLRARTARRPCAFELSEP